MDALRKRIAALRSAGRSSGLRRPSPRARLAIDALEGRRLLSTAAAPLDGMGGGPAPWGRDRSADVAPADPGMGGRGWSDRTTGRDDGPGAAAAAAAAASTSPSGTPTTADRTQADLKALHADLDAIEQASGVTIGQLATLRKDQAALDAAATTDPSSTAEATYDAEVESILGTVPTAAQATQLVADYTAVQVSRGVTDVATIRKVVADEQAIAAASNVPQSSIDAVVAARKAVDADFASARPPASSSSTDPGATTAADAPSSAASKSTTPAASPGLGPDSLLAGLIGVDLGGGGGGVRGRDARAPGMGGGSRDSGAGDLMDRPSDDGGPGDTGPDARSGDSDRSVDLGTPAMTSRADSKADPAGQAAAAPSSTTGATPAASTTADAPADSGTPATPVASSSSSGSPASTPSTGGDATPASTIQAAAPATASTATASTPIGHGHHAGHHGRGAHAPGRTGPGARRGG